MNAHFKDRRVIVMFAGILTFATVSWCQICGKTSYGASPTVEFYVTKLEHISHSQKPTRFYNDVLVQQGSNITLTCTAREPEKKNPALYYGTYLQPYLITWFVNSSLLEVSNCNKKSRKVKTCSLSLVKISPRDHGKYFCQAANEVGCTFKELDLKVAFGEGLKNSDGTLNRRQKNVMSMIRKLAV